MPLLRPVTVAAHLVALVAACGPSSPRATPDAGPCPEGCGPGQVCRGGYCVDEGDPCADVICRHDTRCEDGRCVPGDPCDGVSCDPGEVCSRGECVPAGTDGDGDGYPAEGDCDDGDDEIHPGAEERCNGVDDDCDGEEDEDIPPRACTTPCGAGTETCLEGAWSCDVPESCECLSPGETGTEPCGRCGTRERTCGDDWTWGEWGPCEGDEDCPVECGDGYCEPPETTESCPADCDGTCPVEGHMGDGEHGDPCTATPETWRCVHSASFSNWVAQVCRAGIWQNYAVGPRDCEGCCETFTSAACDAP